MPVLSIRRIMEKTQEQQAALIRAENFDYTPEQIDRALDRLYADIYPDRVIEEEEEGERWDGQS